MASQVFVKAKLGKKFEPVTFAGDAITAVELKIKIMQKKRMDKATDYFLELSYAQSPATMLEDDARVPKNAQVLFKRVSAKGKKKKGSVPVKAEDAAAAGETSQLRDDRILFLSRSLAARIAPPHASSLARWL
uniref:DWNN domain-containing protein n=1 Tax=Phaeomonas parva TaxID=124430 RepID=A0A6U4IDQ7_9STRA|mmetsp:Transcript_39925/g.124873  ORF Transcript_39925/g.124873 Transcript_39925/m.124873 type:complete len:133 (+) Transcript_39925:102-500(+)